MKRKIIAIFLSLGFSVLTGVSSSNFVVFCKQEQKVDMKHKIFHELHHIITFDSVNSKENGIKLCNFLRDNKIYSLDKVLERIEEIFEIGKGSCAEEKKLIEKQMERFENKNEDRSIAENIKKEYKDHLKKAADSWKICGFPIVEKNLLYNKLKENIKSRKLKNEKEIMKDLKGLKIFGANMKSIEEIRKQAVEIIEKYFKNDETIKKELLEIAETYPTEELTKKEVEKQSENLRKGRKKSLKCYINENIEASKRGIKYNNERIEKLEGFIKFLRSNKDKIVEDLISCSEKCVEEYEKVEEREKKIKKGKNSNINFMGDDTCRVGFEIKDINQHLKRLTKTDTKVGKLEKINLKN